MKLTAEQEAIVHTTGNIKINAVAGSGKTSTVIAYAKARPASARILYLAFNRSVRLEAQKKFVAQGLPNVTVETAHSLAYKHIVSKNGYRVAACGYKTHELAAMLGLKGNGEKHHEFILASHINKFITLFCNSDKARVKDINYADTVGDPTARAFVVRFYPYIEKQTRNMLAKMDRGEIEITHDFYLKKFQLQNPVLPYDYILFDEGQDASAAMLGIFLKQPATKLIVGDTHQQIYGWRHAVNSLEKTAFLNLCLSQSFRFDESIATLANRILGWKEIIGNEKTFNILGCGNNSEKITRAFIGRTNLGLLLKAIEYITENKNCGRIYFEGNINSYTYADEGASLYDVLNLYNNKPAAVRDPLLRSMATMPELEDYIEKTEDTQLGMLVEIVKKYGNDIFRIIKTLKEKHIENDDKENAAVVFSTVHRCKGMEYDIVHLVNDFITEEKVQRIFSDVNEDEKKKEKLNEEINLLYVAVTRTKNTLYIPEELLPENFPSFANIKVIKKKTEMPEAKPVIPEIKRRSLYNKYKGAGDGSYAVVLLKTKADETNRPWSKDDDEELRQMYMNNSSDTEIIKHFKRSAGAIRSRMRMLGLREG